MSILLAVLYFVVAVALHAIWCRVSARLSVVVKYVVAGGLVGLALAGHLLVLYGPTTPTLAGILSFALASELYVFMFTLILSSVSAIWLRRLHRGSIESEALAEAYSPAWMVDTRLERLADNAFLTRDGEGYRVTERGRKMMQSFRRLRGFFKHAPRES
jgi:hypothetical protein